MIFDLDIQCIASAFKGLLVTEMQYMLEIDNLEMYSSRSFVKMSCIPEERDKTEHIVLETPIN